MSHLQIGFATVRNESLFIIHLCGVNQTCTVKSFAVTCLQYGSAFKSLLKVVGDLIVWCDIYHRRIGDSLILASINTSQWISLLRADKRMFAIFIDKRTSRIPN